MRCVLLCEPSSLFYLLILFPYKSVTEVRLIFFCKQIYSKKQDLHFSVSRVSRVTQTSWNTQACWKGQKTVLLWHFFYNARIISRKEKKNQNQCLIDTFFFFQIIQIMLLILKTDLCFFIFLIKEANFYFSWLKKTGFNCSVIQIWKGKIRIIVY